MSYEADEGILAHICYAFNRDGINRKQFSNAVAAIAGAWDVVRCTTLFARTEATVKQHFCEWWDDCDGGCVYRRKRDQRPPWQDGWVAFSWVPAERPQPVQEGRRSTLIAKDARSVVTPQLRRQIFARDGHRCKGCGSPPPLEVDHIIPVCKGGSSDDDNLQSLCGPCNRKKGATIEPVTA